MEHISYSQLAQEVSDKMERSASLNGPALGTIEELTSVKGAFIDAIIAYENSEVNEEHVKSFYQAGTLVEQMIHQIQNEEDE